MKLELLFNLSDGTFLNLIRHNSTWQISIGENGRERPIVKTIQNDVLYDQSIGYSNNQGSGVLPNQREYYKNFQYLNIPITTSIDNLIRAFPVTEIFLHSATNWDNSDFALKMYEEGFENLNDQILIDWTGNMGDAQPDMYFIKKELCENPGVENLYKKGLLGKFKYIISLEQESIFTTYFVPFTIPEARENGVLWNNIIEGKNQAIKRLVANEPVL